MSFISPACPSLLLKHYDVIWFLRKMGRYVCVAIGLETNREIPACVFVVSCARESLGWILGKISSPECLSSSGTGCPGQWWNQHLWRYLRDTKLWHLGMWFRGGLCNAGLTAGLNGIKGLFQPRQFHGCVKYVLLAGDDPKCNVVGLHAEVILLLTWSKLFQKIFFPYFCSFTKAEKTTPQHRGGL